jgi:hypothetical protein
LLQTKPLEVLGTVGETSPQPWITQANREVSRVKLEHCKKCE